MSTLKCKMCGGALKYEEGKTVVECEYCGSLNTIPNIGDEKRLQLFDRANRLRSSCDFEKASGVYESIVAEYPEEAEAYWGLVLCKYGIEYVDDPATGKKVPTCHRSSFDSLFDDDNFDQVMENCDQYSRDVYRDEAKQIEEIRKGIVEISSKADPYDIFICYKETDDNGDRTVDSLIAQDIYDALVAKDYKVFFARITLEDKLGQEYEPYIFAALNSAKVMLVVGTNYGNFNAVWVKNEWTRYLKLMEKDKTKYLVPCYRDIDAYDMPKEFSKLQAQDMSKVGAIQDLVRGIEKMVPRGDNARSTDVGGGADISALIKRMNTLLVEKEWKNAEIITENILTSDPNNASAYIGKLMVERKASEEKDLKNSGEPLDKSRYYAKAIAVADASTKQRLEEINAFLINQNKKKKRKVTIVIVSVAAVVAVIVGVYLLITKVIPDSKYNKAMELYNAANYDEAIAAFTELGTYNNADQMLLQCKYNFATGKLDSGEFDEAKAAFVELGDFNDAYQMVNQCDYDKAQKLYASGKYDDAKEIFAEIGVFKDASSMVYQCDYAKAQELDNNGNRMEAMDIYYSIKSYKDAGKRYDYYRAIEAAEGGNYSLAIQILSPLSSYLDSQELIVQWKYKYAAKLFSDGEYERASNYYCELKDYNDSQEMYFKCLSKFSGGEKISFAGYEWQVLDRKDSRLLLLCTEIVNSSYFGESNSWNDSYIRRNLNGSFIKENFTESEISRLVTTNGDKVFLLSNNEYKKYENKIAKIDGFVIWWLRSPGYKNYVSTAGSEDGFSPDEVYGVRPAMWIDTSL